MTESPINSFLSPVSGGLTKIIFDVIQRAGGKAFEAIRDRHIIDKASKQYIERYNTRYGTVRLLGMKKGIPLMQIYTKVKFLDDLSIRRFESIELMEKAYRESASRRLQMRQRVGQDGTSVVNEYQFLTVLGGPGAGKSTFLRRVGLEALKGDEGSYQHECIPVLLELKRFNSDGVDLRQAITKEFENFGFPPSEAFASRALEQGKLLILLDGLDEVPKVRLNQVIESIQDFVTRYGRNGNRFIVSCRIAAYHTSFQGFTDVELADFDDIQIQQFIENWFQSPLDQETNTAQKCWNILNNPSNKAAKELAQTPLLLTFLCLIYHRSQNLPSNRSWLYRKALDIFLEEWAAEKRISQDQVYQGLHPDLEIALLSEIAYQTFTIDQLFFTKQVITTQITTFLSDTLNAPKYLDGKAVLNAIEIQQGILVQRAEDIYSFSHLTLQEYLTAQYIAQSEQRIKQAVEQHLTDDRWREVFLLIFGSLQSADEMLNFIHQRSRNYVITPKLQAVLQWANRVTTGSAGDYQPAAKRATAIDLALDLARARVRTTHLDIAHTRVRDLIHTLANSFNIVYELDLDLACSCASLLDLLSLDPALASAIDPFLDPALDCIRDRALACVRDRTFASPKILNLDLGQLDNFRADIPDDSQSSAVRKSFADSISHAFFSVLGLDPEWLDLSEAEVESLAHYLYICELMIHGKETAVRVSRDRWNVIAQQMMLMPDSSSDSSST